MIDKSKLLIHSLILVLSSCATGTNSLEYVVNIDSFSHPSINSKLKSMNKKYIIVPGNKNTPSSDLRFLEYSKYVKRAMRKHGYTFTSKANNADLGIVLSYAISEPIQEAYSYTSPRLVYDQGKTYNYNATTTSNQYNAYGNNQSYTTNGTVSTQGTYKTVYDTYSGVNTFFTRKIVIDAYNSKLLRKSKGKKVEKLWSTEIVSTGSSGDLRSVFPALISAAMPFMGTNSLGKKTVRISENSSAIQYVKTGRTSDQRKPASVSSD